MNPVNFAWWIRGAEFADLARISMHSVRKVYGTDAKLWLVTDDPVLEWKTPCTRSIIRVPVKYPQDMVANVDCQYELMKRLETDSKVIFLDADAIVTKRFPEIDTDLMVTWRDHVNGDAGMAREQPYNYGVMGCKVTPQTMEMMVWLRYRILQMSPQNQAWYGNQLAMADLLGQPRGERFTATMRWTLNDPGTPLSVLSLPCDQWNYSPSSMDEDVSGRSVLHFKGNRKEWMERYA